jgi:hypothetical protein
MEKTGTSLILSEDREFDRVAWVKRLWLAGSAASGAL